MKCPQCNSDIGDESKFCKECGTNITSREEAQPSFTKTLETPIEELSTGSTFAGRYQIIEELGKGGMGKVYKAVDTRIKEKIALKLIKPEISSDRKTLERFGNELKLARKIVHKNVGRMFDINEEKSTHYITMEYVSGQDLKGLIRQSGQLALSTSISIAKQICEGLSEAHKVGVVHRDLKPHNIMIDREGEVRIMDFGIARSLKEKGITGAGVMIGTPEYMSPEQVESKETDQRSDIYSLGIILYEMVTGRVPFEGDSPFSIGVKQKSENPRPPKEINDQIPEDLNRVILKCMEKEKESRYQGAGELHSELMKLEKGIPTAERIVPERKPLTSREITVQFSLKKLFIPAVIVITIAIIGVVLWQLLPHKEALLAPKIENSIAVISFKNQTGDPAYDYLQAVIPNLLITNLENTGWFHVTTWERMKDILKQMGVGQTKFIDSDLGFELCRRAGIGAIAIGTLSKAGNVFIMDVKVLDAENKQTLKSTNTKGTGADSIFKSQIDELSREISLGLGAALDKVEAAHLDIKGITTHSLEAYQYLLKGKEALSMAAWSGARKDLEKALEADPSFAMAYVYLAWTYFEPLQEESLVETIKKGLTLADGISQKDRLYLDGLYAYFVEHDVAEAVMHLDELLQKYPDEKWALHMSGDFLRMDDDLDQAYARYKKWLELDLQDANALWHFTLVCQYMRDRETAEQYIKMHEAVASTELGNLARLAQVYLRMGQLDKALAKRKELLEIRPDLKGNFGIIADIYSLKGEYEEALKWADEYVSLASTLGQKMSSFFSRGTIHFLRGAFDDALADFTLEGQAAEEAEDVEEVGYAQEARGLVYLVRGDYEASRKSFENMPMDPQAENLNFSWSYRADRAFDLGMLALEQGQTGPAKAKLSEIKSLQPGIREDKIYINFISDLLQGGILLAQGALDEALAAGKMACGPESPIWRLGNGIYGPPVYYMDLLARIYAKKGDIGQAISEYELLLKVNYSTSFSFTIYPLYHYRLGLLYERANETAKAAAQYEKFLTLWKDADPGIVEVEDARERLAGLRDLHRTSTSEN